MTTSPGNDVASSGVAAASAPGAGLDPVLPLSISLVDVRGNYLAMNDGAARVLGSDAIGHNYTSIFTSPMLEATQRLHREILADARPRLGVVLPYVSPFTREKRYSRMDRYPVFGDDGAVCGIVSYNYDVSDSVRLCASLTDLAQLRADAIMLLHALTTPPFQRTPQPAHAWSTAVSNAATYARMLDQSCERHGVTPPAEPNSPSYIGPRLCGVVGEYAQHSALGSGTADGTDAGPTLSLEIAVDVPLSVFCEESVFDSMLRHLLEFATANCRGVVHVCLLSVSQGTAQVALDVHGVLSEPAAPCNQLHFYAAQRALPLSSSRLRFSLLNIIDPDDNPLPLIGLAEERGFPFEHTQRKDGRFRMRILLPVASEQLHLPPSLLPPRRMSVDLAPPASPPAVQTVGATNAANESVATTHDTAYKQYLRRFRYESATKRKRESERQEPPQLYSYQ